MSNTKKATTKNVTSAGKGKHSKKTKTESKASQLVKKVQKRDGSLVDFDLDRIANVIYKAMIASGEGSDMEASMVANKVFADLVRITKKYKNFVPTVEGIQETVEKELILSEYINTAKNYILYRHERSKLRDSGLSVPEHVKKMAKESKKHFRNSLGEFVYYRTYSRWIEEENRRETWVETVDRYVDFMKENLGENLKEKEYKEVREHILNQQSMPSMRLMQFSGPAARRCNVVAYNCSFIAPAKIDHFAEIMYISMCGTGVGYSVESRNIQALPQVQEQMGKAVEHFVVDDSKEGWADALKYGMKAWFEGRDVEFDFSKLRPAGARLKVMGGKSSGPGPLRSILDFTRAKILSRQGKRLRNIDAHDIICKIGEGVVAGGVRRSAMISLSDLDDDEMRDAKKGQFYLTEPQRALANNSAVYTQKPSNEEFMDEWVALMKSGSGERGIFNRGGLQSTLPERRLKVLNGELQGLGTNPCGEIILQGTGQFCNLSEIVARADDTEESLLKKMRVAAILGTYQSTLTKFGYLSKQWKENCEKERLLGVSITGQWDCPAVRDEKVLEKLKVEAIRVNKEYAKRFGVNQSTCVTCVKPSGTVSQTVDCASGMHARYAKYYIRRIRISATDALFRMLRDQGVPYSPEVGQTKDSATTFVLDFPVKAPEGAIVGRELTAMDQLEHWKMVKKHYTEHNPSTTISVAPNEWLAVANWLYENWDYVGGLSFLPKDDHVYQLAPYEEIDEEKYRELSKRFENIDFSKIVTYEAHDETEQKREMACVSGTCEI